MTILGLGVAPCAAANVLNNTAMVKLKPKWIRMIRLPLSYSLASDRRL